MWAASLPMTGGMAHARVRTRLTGALVALVAAWAPAGAADAAIGPQQVEALDRQGATEIIVRREPGLSAAERADVRADADVDARRAAARCPTPRSSRADAGDLAEAVAELNRDPDVDLRRAGHRPVRAQTPTRTTARCGASRTRARGRYIPGSGELLRPAPPTPTWTSPRPGRRPPAPASRVGDRRHRRADHAPRPRRPDRDQRGRDRHRRARTATSAPTASTTTATATSTTGRAGTSSREYPSIGVSEGDGTAGPRQRPAGQPRPRHARRRHRRRRSATTTRASPASRPAPRSCRCARSAPTARGSSLAIAEAFDYAGKMGVRDRQRQPRRPGPGPVAARGDPGAPEHAVRDRGRQRQRQRRRHALRPVRAAGGQHPVRRRVRRERPQAPRSPTTARSSVDVFAPGTAILSTYLVARVRVPAGHVDGQPEHGRRRGARALGAPGR